MTANGLYTFVYDMKNRLIEIVPTTPNATYDKKLVFSYDYMGRRVRKRVYTHDGSGWPSTTTSDQRFFYDGWTLDTPRWSCRYFG